MPRDTWWNLPEEKRERITDAALAEFGQHGFSAGSLNVIAREAGIAKGSLFQYFDDKLDMFATVASTASGRIAEATLGSVDPDLPFWELLHDLVIGWLDFYRRQPGQQRFSFAAANEIDSEARAAVRGVANEFYAKSFRPVVDRAIVEGQIRSDASPELVISMIVLVMRHLNSAPFDPVGDPSINFPGMSDAEVDAVALHYVEVLRRAFAP